MLETRNFIINNYNGVWGLCHDDGSNGYVDTFNFLPWSGTKNCERRSVASASAVSPSNPPLHSPPSPAQILGSTRRR